MVGRGVGALRSRPGGGSVVKVPEGSDYRQQWGRLDSATRRRIVRAVNKGEVLESRKEAALAVATARRQQRFWKKAWMLGPLAALLTLGQGIVVYVANAILSTAIIGLMAFFWSRRAERAAAANLEAASGKKGKKRKPGQTGNSKGGGSGRSSHLPRRPDRP